MTLDDPKMYGEPSVFRKLDPEKAEDKALWELAEK